MAEKFTGRQAWLEAKQEARPDLSLAKTHVDEELASPAEVAAIQSELAKAGDTQADRILPWTVSTEARDRDNDRIKIAGIHLVNFRKNPVILFAHDARSLPIGTAKRVFRDEGAKGPRLRMLKQFASEDENPEAEKVFRLVKAGILRMASIGFRTEKAIRDPELGEDDPFGILFQQIDLLESSVVPIPSNPEALQEAKSFDLSVCKDWSERVLDENGEHSVLVVPRPDIERAYDIITGEKRIFVLCDSESEIKTEAKSAEPAPAEPAPAESATPKSDPETPALCTSCGVNLTEAPCATETVVTPPPVDSETVFVLVETSDSGS